MTKLIFDIETTGVKFNSLDQKSQDFLLANTEPEKIEAVKQGLGFSPLTGRVIAIGVLNPDTDKGAVYYISDQSEKINEDDVNYVPCRDEKELLKTFWEVATHYNQFITFAGHVFDIPYLMIRSAVLKIKPTVNLMQNRYNPLIHLDLMDKLTNYGALRIKNNLHLWCNTFGIESPKENISGHDVAGLFEDRKYLDIAKYCYGDIVATKDLYEYWNKYLNIK